MKPGEHARRVAAGHRVQASVTPTTAEPYAHWRAMAAKEARERGEVLSDEEISRRAHHLATARAHDMVAARAVKSAKHPKRPTAPIPVKDETLRDELRRLHDQVGRLTARICLLEQAQQACPPSVGSGRDAEGATFPTSARQRGQGRVKGRGPGFIQELPG